MHCPHPVHYFSSMLMIVLFIGPRPPAPGSKYGINPLAGHSIDHVCAGNPRPARYRKNKWDEGKKNIRKAGYTGPGILNLCPA